MNYLIIFILLLPVFILFANEDDIILKIYDIYPEQIVRKGFALGKDLEIGIDVIVGIVRDKDYLLSACWILNAESRDVAWECSIDNGDRIGQGRELRFNHKLNLSKGNYEVYYALHLTPWCVISPDIQVITNPGGNKNARDALVGGVRVRLSL